MSRKIWDATMENNAIIHGNAKSKTTLADESIDFLKLSTLLAQHKYIIVNSKC